MEKFTLINKDRSRIKFLNYLDVSKPVPRIDTMMISLAAFIKEVVNQL